MGACAPTAEPDPLVTALRAQADVREALELLGSALATLGDDASAGLPVPLHTGRTKGGLLTLGVGGSFAPVSLASVAQLVADRIEALLTLRHPRLRQPVRHPPSKRGYERG